SRAAAATALGHLGPAAKDTVPALQNALRDPDESVRTAAAIALSRLAPDQARNAVGVLVQALQKEIAAKSSPSLSDRLLLLASWDMDPDPPKPSEPLQALARIGPRAHAAVPALVKILRGGEPGGDAAGGDAVPAPEKIFRGLQVEDALTSGVALTLACISADHPAEAESVFEE